MREKGLAESEEEAELPGEMSRDMHPLWEVVVKGCQFNTFGKAKKVRSSKR